MLCIAKMLRAGLSVLLRSSWISWSPQAKFPIHHVLCIAVVYWRKRSGCSAPGAVWILIGSGHWKSKSKSWKYAVVRHSILRFIFAEYLPGKGGLPFPMDTISPISLAKTIMPNAACALLSWLEKFHMALSPNAEWKHVKSLPLSFIPPPLAVLSRLLSSKLSLMIPETLPYFSHESSLTQYTENSPTTWKEIRKKLEIHKLNSILS